MTISLDRELALDLITSKIEQLDLKIEEILVRWSITSVTEFLDKTKKGELIEGVPDAVSLRNLMDKRNSLAQRLNEADLN